MSGAIASLTALACTLALSIYAIRGFLLATAEVEHTVQVRRAVSEVLTTLLDAETGERGFAITGDPAYLQPHQAANARLPEALSTLLALTNDNAAQQVLLATVERDSRLEMAELTELLGSRPREGGAPLGQSVHTTVGKSIMDGLRRDLAAMDAEEVRLFQKRKQAQTRNAVLSVLALALSSALFGLLLFRAAAARRVAAARELVAAAEAKQLGAENESLAERARTNEFQERFVAILGHDLRNPLASFAMGVDLLKRSSPANWPSTLARMSRSSARMSNMVEQLLDLTRSRLGGGIAVAPAAADLGVLVRGVVDELHAAQPAPRVVVQAQGSLAGLWDAARLEQVISNLVGNALSHGAADLPVQVDLRGSDGVVTLAVHNGGAAIPQALQLDLFQPFRRGERDTMSRRTSGLGLGLFISKEIVQAHGGTIAVISSDQDGTTFTVRLPRESRPSGDLEKS